MRNTSLNTRLSGPSKSKYYSENMNKRKQKERNRDAMPEGRFNHESFSWNGTRNFPGFNVGPPTNWKKRVWD